MKRNLKDDILLIIWLLLLILIVIVIFKPYRYTNKTEHEFKQMKSPIVLIEKYKMIYCYSVELKDSTGKIYKWGNISRLANLIGNHYNIGDTIKKEDFFIRCYFYNNE